MVGTGADYFVLPTLGVPASRRWAESSSGVCPGVLVAAGQYDMAMHILYSQAGIVNFAPLKPFFALTHQSAHASVSTIPNLEAIVSPIFAVRFSRVDNAMLMWDLLSRQNISCTTN